MTPLQYLRKHCVIRLAAAVATITITTITTTTNFCSNHRMAYFSEIFTKCDKDKDLKLNLEVRS